MYSTPVVNVVVIEEEEMDRKSIKEKGKAAFKANYWPSVLAGFLMTMAVGGSAAASFRSSQSEMNELQANMENVDTAVLIAILVAILGAIALVLTISTILNIFVMRPLEVGCQTFFRKNLEAPAETGELVSGFKNNYGKNVITLLLRDVFLCLWSCLFLIPGIIKSYSYRFVPFIRAEHPEMSATEVITESRRMMNGHKWEAFVFDLSFLGWFLLAGLTCNILGLFYVSPYYYNSCANYYEAVKGQDSVSVVE